MFKILSSILIINVISSLTLSEEKSLLETTEGVSELSFFDSLFGLSNHPVVPVNDLDLDKFVGDWN